MSCFRTWGRGKEHGTNKPTPTRRVRERSKGDTTGPTTSQNPSLWHPSWPNKACTTRKDSESGWLAKDNPETNPITIKPETAWQSCSPGFPYRTALPWVPFPNNISCFVNTCVSSDNSVLSVRQEPSFGPWKGSPFLQQLQSDFPSLGLTGSHWRAAIRSYPRKYFMINFCPMVLGGSSQLSQKFLLCHSRS